MMAPTAEAVPDAETHCRLRKAAAFERRVRRLCDPQSPDADVLRIRKELLGHLA